MWRMIVNKGIKIMIAIVGVWIVAWAGAIGAFVGALGNSSSFVIKSAILAIAAVAMIIFGCKRWIRHVPDKECEAEQEKTKNPGISGDLIKSIGLAVLIVGVFFFVLYCLIASQ